MWLVKPFPESLPGPDLACIKLKSQKKIEGWKKGNILKNNG